MSDEGVHDLSRLMSAEAEVRRWRAESENSSARLELANMKRNMAHLLSQHEPLCGLDVDRDQLRVLFTFVCHNDKKRLERDIKKMKENDA